MKEIELIDFVNKCKFVFRNISDGEFDALLAYNLLYGSSSTYFIDYINKRYKELSREKQWKV